ETRVLVGNVSAKCTWRRRKRCVVHLVRPFRRIELDVMARSLSEREHEQLGSGKSHADYQPTGVWRQSAWKGLLNEIGIAVPVVVANEGFAFKAVNGVLKRGFECPLVLLGNVQRSRQLRIRDAHDGRQSHLLEVVLRPLRLTEH